jgi:hypothetical protein
VVKEIAVGRVIVTEFISLDGVIEDPGGSEKGKTDFPHGGWTSASTAARKVTSSRSRSCEPPTLSSSAASPTRDSPRPGRDANDDRRIRREDERDAEVRRVDDSWDADATWENTKVIRGDVRGAVERLKTDIKGDILIAGARSWCRASPSTASSISID